MLAQSLEFSMTSFSIEIWHLLPPNEVPVLPSPTTLWLKECDRKPFWIVCLTKKPRCSKSRKSFEVTCAVCETNKKSTRSSGMARKAPKRTRQLSKFRPYSKALPLESSESELWPNLESNLVKELKMVTILAILISWPKMTLMLKLSWTWSKRTSKKLTFSAEQMLLWWKNTSRCSATSSSKNKVEPACLHLLVDLTIGAERISHHLIHR